MRVVKSFEAIKEFFERPDAVSPKGGRKVENTEIIAYTKGNPKGSTRELALLCAAQLGVELESALPVKDSAVAAN